MWFEARRSLTFEVTRERWGDEANPRPARKSQVVHRQRLTRAGWVRPWILPAYRWLALANRALRPCDRTSNRKTISALARARPR